MEVLVHVDFVVDGRCLDDVNVDFYMFCACVLMSNDTAGGLS